MFHNFFEKSRKLQKSQFLLGTLLPPVTLVVINFSKNCDFSNFSQFLEESQKLQKSQFLLDTLVPPVTLDLINFSKNCDFSNFLQFLEKLQKSQFLLGTLVPPLPLEFSNVSKSAISPIFRNFRYCVQNWTYRAQSISSVGPNIYLCQPSTANHNFFFFFSQLQPEPLPKAPVSRRLAASEKPSDSTKVSNCTLFCYQFFTKQFLFKRFVISRIFLLFIMKCDVFNLTSESFDV